MQIKINGWKQGITFSASHLIPKHGKCSRLHGHEYSVVVRVGGEKRDNMVVDFSLLKNALKDTIKPLDHKVLIPFKKATKKDSEIEVKEAGKRYVFPQEDVKLLSMNAVTAENLAEWILTRLSRRLTMENLSAIELRLDEGGGQGAWVRKKL